MTEKTFIEFIENELNENNTKHNATGYRGMLYANGHIDIDVTFNRNARELYNKLLMFCAVNELMIVRTHPGTYATTVRI